MPLPCRSRPPGGGITGRSLGVNVTHVDLNWCTTRAVVMVTGTVLCRVRPRWHHRAARSGSVSPAEPEAQCISAGGQTQRQLAGSEMGNNRPLQTKHHRNSFVGTLLQ
ncbi:hypothetical protein SKAU_G00028880 [Synaphobranchus kaupii]|uniref:Uncharacterized protein n=1 Tax=Synaphobranchus kaupii TaxID=118154 RepID=A0A9Q1JET4_SYNKA|nr:hypothetical protein SKAU_G00028880 [Synaphobranchus kaupii]